MGFGGDAGAAVGVAGEGVDGPDVPDVAADVWDAGVGGAGLSCSFLWVKMGFFFCMIHNANVLLIPRAGGHISVSRFHTSSH